MPQTLNYLLVGDAGIGKVSPSNSREGVLIISSVILGRTDP